MIDRKQILIFLLRGSSIGIKAFFLFFCAKNLSLADFGELALINNGISIMIGFMGVNLFSYTSRIIATTPEIRETITKHLILVIISGVLSLIATPFLVLFGGISSSYIIKFVLILLLEHIYTEIFRIQVPLNKNTEANLFHLARICSSSLLPAILYVIDPTSFTIDNILSVWLFSLLAFSGFYAKHLFEFRLPSSKALQRFIREGMRVSGLYLIVSLMSRAIFTVDKIFVNEAGGSSEVGTYTFFYSVAFTIQTLAETGIIAVSMHEMLNTSDLRKSLKRLVLRVAVFTVLLSTCLNAMIPLILKGLNKVEFMPHTNLLVMFTISASVFSIALAVMMPLYAKKKDKTILYAHLVAFVFFIVINMFNGGGMYQVAANMVASYIVLLCSLLFGLRSISTHEL